MTVASARWAGVGYTRLPQDQEPDTEEEEERGEEAGSYPAAGTCAAQ